MGKVFKILGLALGAVIVVAILAVIGLVTLVDPNDYRAEMAETVQRYTGRTVEFSGDLHLSFFPWMGVEAAGLRIGNPESFGGGDFASLKKVGIHIKLVPLLKRDIQISAISVEGFHLNLVRNAQGKTNWTFVPQDTGSPSAAPASGKTESGKDDTPASPLAALLVESVAISKSSVSFTDMRSKERYQLNDLNLTTSSIAMDTPVTISLKAALAASKPAVDATLALDSTVYLAGDLSRLDLDGVTLALDATGSVLPGGRLSLRHVGAFSFDMPRRTGTIKKCTLSAYDTTMATHGVLRLAGGPEYSGSVTLETALRKALTTLGVALRTSDPDVLKNASLSFDLQASPLQVRLAGLRGALDDTTFSGSFLMRQFSRPDIKTDLTVSPLDLDRYLPPDTESSEPKATGTQPPDAAPGGDIQNADLIPEKTRTALRRLVLDASLKMAALTVKKIPVTDITVHATARDGLLRVSPCSAAVFDGRIDSDLTADLRKADMRTAVAVRTKDIKLDTLTQTLTGTRHASGTAVLTTDLATTGNTLRAMRDTLEGKGAFNVSNGAIYGFQIIPEEAKEHIKGSNADKVDDAVRKQVFDRLSGSFTAYAGRISNNDLAFVSPNLNAEGAGYADLRRDRIDYRATIRLSGLPDLPVSVTGSFERPSYGFDAGVFLKNTLKGVQDLLPIPGLFGTTRNQTGESDTESSGDTRKTNPLKQLGKGLQQLFK